MAIAIIGETNCCLCGKLLEDSDDILSFPAFVVIETDPVHQFSDQVCHLTCFERHPLAEVVTSRLNEWRQNTGPGTRACIVCGEEVTDPDDYLLIEHLTSESDSPLHQFNFTHLHQSHVCDWEDRQQLVELLRDRISDHGYQEQPAGNHYINTVIAKLSEC